MIVRGRKERVSEGDVEARVMRHENVIVMRSKRRRWRSKMGRNRKEGKGGLETKDQRSGEERRLR